MEITLDENQIINNAVHATVALTGLFSGLHSSIEALNNSADNIPGNLLGYMVTHLGKFYATFFSQVSETTIDILSGTKNAKESFSKLTEAFKEKTTDMLAFTEKTKKHQYAKGKYTTQAEREMFSNQVDCATYAVSKDFIDKNEKALFAFVKSIEQTPQKLINILTQKDEDLHTKEANQIVEITRAIASSKDGVKDNANDEPEISSKRSLLDSIKAKSLSSRTNSAIPRAKAA